MEKFNFDTGMKEFEINDAVTVSFNPTDPETIKKKSSTSLILWMQSRLLTRQKSRDAAKRKRSLTSPAAATRKCVRCWTVFFGKPICEPLFGTMNVYALADGLPVWCNLMLAIIDQIDTRSFAGA